MDPRARFWTTVALVVVLVLGAGGLWAASTVQNLPPGTTLTGEPVADPADALRLGEQLVARVDALPVVVTTAAGRTTLTAGELGASFDQISLDRAVAGNVGLGRWIDRLTGAAPLELPAGLLFTTGQADAIAERLSSQPVDGDVDVTASGVRVTDAVVGVSVTPESVNTAFRQAARRLEALPLAEWPDELAVEVDGDTVQPTVPQVAVDVVVERIEQLTATPVRLTAQARPEDSKTVEGQGVPTREEITLELAGEELLQLLDAEVDPDALQRERLRVVTAVDAPPRSLTAFLEDAAISPDLTARVVDRSPTPTKVEDPQDVGPGGPADLPVYADVSTVTGTIEAEVDLPGLEPDVEATARGIVEAMLAGEDTATVRGEAIEEFDLAEDYGLVEPVSTFTTFYEPGQSRVTNIHRIAELVDGALVPPGGNYEVNHAVGARTPEGGFVPAGAILEGEFITDVGGGVSQFATTFFNAMWFSGIDIITHTPHSFWFERYPAAREATIDFPGVDLELNNNTPHWILIDTAVTEDSVTVTFWSTRWFDVATTMGEREPTSGEGFRMRIARRAVAPDGAVDDDTFTVEYGTP